MNILISTLVNPPIQNGLSKYIIHLIQALQELDSNHRFFILTNKEFGDLIKIKNSSFKKIQVNLPHYPRFIMRPLYFIWQNTLFGRILKEHEIDVFHSPNPVPIFYTFNTPYVTTIHDIAEYSIPRVSKFRRTIRILATETSIKRSSELITVSNFSKTQILKKTKAKEDKVHVIYPGITISYEKNHQIEERLINTPYLLHVGGTKPNKNIDNILEAFLNARKIDKTKFVFIGDNSEVKKKYNLAELKHKGIIFKGFISESDLISYYKNAIALVYASTYEGFGLPIIEAMSLGLPVITSNCTSLPEVVSDAALLVNPYNINSITSAIENVLTNNELRKSLSRKGIKRAAFFKWETSASQTLKIYEKSVKTNFLSI